MHLLTWRCDYLRCFVLLRFSITCGLQNSKLNWQMRFSFPSINCSAAPPSLRLCYLNCAQRFDLTTAHLVEVGSKEEPPNIWLMAAKNTFAGWALNFGVRMLLTSAVTTLTNKLSLQLIQCGNFQKKIAFIKAT